MCVFVETVHDDDDYRQENPRKWTFYNASILDLLIGINDATFEISQRGILMLYASGDKFEIKPNGGTSLFAFPCASSHLLLILAETSGLGTFQGENRSMIGLKMKQFNDESLEHPVEEW